MRCLGACDFSVGVAGSSTSTNRRHGSWSNGKMLFWIADAKDKKHKHRNGHIGFDHHHYAFELASRSDVDALGAFLEKHGMTVVDPPGEY